VSGASTTAFFKDGLGREAFSTSVSDARRVVLLPDTGNRNRNISRIKTAGLAQRKLLLRSASLVKIFMNESSYTWYT
jgi:hypothetical protein